MGPGPLGPVVDGPSAGTPAPSLDEGTKLGIGAWITLYPEAGEGSIVGGQGITVHPSAGEEVERQRVRLSDGVRHESRTQHSPPPSREESDRAGRRARGQVRRYAVANGVNRLLTLTYRPPQPVDPEPVLRDVAAFLKLLRADRPDLAYVRVLERHKSGAIHVHVGVSGAGSKLDRERLARLWGRGFIDVRKIRSNRPGRREAARSAARYLAKYVGKDAVRVDGGHRYEVRQGCQPRAVRTAARSLDDGWRVLVGLAGGEVPAYDWSSSGDPDWNGPPVRFLSWV